MTQQQTGHQPHGAFCFEYEGQTFPWQEKFITGAELRQEVGEFDQPIVWDQADGGEVTVTDDLRIDLGKPCRFGTSAFFRRGEDSRMDAECRLLRTVYPSVTMSETGWVEIPDYRFPPDLFNRKTGRLGYQIPPAYTATPPDTFFLDPNLKKTNGEPPDNSSAGQTPHGEPMLVFSFHMDGRWKPSASVQEGDNLLTLTRAIGRFLRGEAA